MENLVRRSFRRRCLGLLIIFIILSSSHAFGQAGVGSSDGNLLGKQALRFYPGDRLPTGKLVPRQDLAACEVHMVPASDLDSELVTKCGVWMLPPAVDRYLVWLEQGNTISSQVVLGFNSAAFEGIGSTSVLEMMPSGYVYVSAAPPGSDTYRLVTLEKGNRFDRRLPVANVPLKVRMPAGNALMAAFDSAGDALSVTRPFAVRPSKPARPALRSGKESDVLLVLNTPERHGVDGYDLTVVLGGSRRRPDALAEGPERLVAVWYDVREPSVELRVESDAFEPILRKLALSVSHPFTVRDRLSKTADLQQNSQ